ncbi:MAG: DUF1152 domain-containing protein [Desulfurococcaceae archaeon]
MKVMLLAIGGGGDIISTAVLSRSLMRQNIKTVIASIAWERYINDPSPGPLRLDEIVNFVEKKEGYILIDGRSYAVRGGYKVIFQAARVSEALNEKIYIIDLYGGVNGYVKSIREIVAKEGIDLIIGVDVGGDSIAVGCEEGLWSPLADWMGLSALHVVKGKLALHSPGSDGELEQQYLLSRIDHIASKGGLLGIRLLCESDAKLLENILERASTEASLISLLAYRGRRGELTLRGGTRKVTLSFLSTLTFLLDTNIVIEDIRPARELTDTKSIYEANKLLNAYGIYTELDFEEDLARANIKPYELSADLVMRIRKSGKERVAKSAMINYCREVNKSP